MRNDGNKNTIPKYKLWEVQPTGPNTVAPKFLDRSEIKSAETLWEQFQNLFCCRVSTFDYTDELNMSEDIHNDDKANSDTGSTTCSGNERLVDSPSVKTLSSTTRKPDDTQRLTPDTLDTTLMKCRYKIKSYQFETELRIGTRERPNQIILRPNGKKLGSGAFGLAREANQLFHNVLPWPFINVTYWSKVNYVVKKIECPEKLENYEKAKKELAICKAIHNDQLQCIEGSEHCLGMFYGYEYKGTLHPQSDGNSFCPPQQKGTKVGLVSEKVYGSNLSNESYKNFLRQHPLIMRIVMKQILRGAAYLHDNKGVVHNDLKPDNIMWDPDNNAVKIIDFGFAGLKGHDPYQGSGTFIFMDPKLYHLNPHHRPVMMDTSSDMFSLGVTFMDLLIPDFYGKVLQKLPTHCRSNPLIYFQMNPDFYPNVLRDIITTELPLQYGDIKDYNAMKDLIQSLLGIGSSCIDTTATTALNYLERLRIPHNVIRF